MSNHMFAFNILLYSSLFICIVGLGYRIGSWFVLKVGVYGKKSSVASRISAAFKAIFRVLFSLKVLKLFQSFISDVVFQRRIFVKAGFFRWLAHILIFYGFMLLLFMHALDDMITQRLFPDYYSTINPFLFLRSFFGAMVVIGLFLALSRRFFKKQLRIKTTRIKTTRMDAYAIFIVAFIIFSGIFLEGLTMTSHSEFERMLSDYAGLYDEEEITALEGFWVENYALVSSTIAAPVDAELLSLGDEVNDTYCMSCHVSNQWGFLGYGIAQIVQPFAVWLDQNGGVTLFWYIHIVSCFLGLALLPFTKMFHMVSVPVSMFVSAVRNDDISAPENLATINAMELDACTHCGVCTQSCSAAMMSEVIGNEYILPSEKMRALKNLMRKRRINQKELDAICQGIYVCTSCERCTVDCPSGIGLKDLWVNVREDLIQSHVPESSILSPFSFVRGIQRESRPGIYKRPIHATPVYAQPIMEALNAVCSNGNQVIKDEAPLVFGKTIQSGRTEKPVCAGDFAACFDCRNCTLICPVVASYEKPEETLGMLPHQIMCSLGLNLIDPASQSAMIWYCLTCYQCQEHCPQNVLVCDHLYSLKNYAANKLVPEQKPENFFKFKAGDNFNRRNT